MKTSHLFGILFAAASSVTTVSGELIDVANDIYLATTVTGEQQGYADAIDTNSGEKFSHNEGPLYVWIFGTTDASMCACVNIA